MEISEISVACPSKAVLQQFLQDDLAHEDAGRINSHVSSCASCQRVLGLLVGTRFPSLAETNVSEQTAEFDHNLHFPRLWPAEQVADDEPPRLDGYEVLGPLGAGGMGVVWRVRDLEFGRDLALKVMKAGLCHEPDLERRFLNEAHICGRLTHPTIVPVHALGRLDDGRPYYLMKLVQGQTLTQLLRAQTPDERRTEGLRIFSHVCQAVAYAHGRKVIHRDLKPSNVMVGEHGEVQLMDWGLAKVLADSESQEESAHPQAAVPETRPKGKDHTHPGQGLGTLAYMPPEQARGLVGEMDERSDVFGLGAILCEILTGRPPYVATKASSLLRQATDPQLEAASARLQGCGADPKLIRLAEKCLAANKTDRPAHGGEVAAAVAAYQAAEAERQRQAEVEKAAAAARRRARQIVLVLACAALAMVAFLAPPRRDPNEIRIGVKPWVGYTPLAVADELKLFGPRVRIKLVPIENLEAAQQALLKGEIDVAMWLVDTHVLARSRNLSTKVVLKLDESLTADAFVAGQQISTFADLRGKTVAYQKEEASYFLFLELCEKYGIDPRLIQLEGATAAGAADAFIRGEVDAAATYDPHLRRALQVPGAHIVASGADVPGTIVDVLTVEQKYLEAHPENVERLLEGWFKAVAILTDPESEHHEAAVAIACKFNGDPGGAHWRTSTPCSRADYAAMEAGMRYSTLADNRDFFDVSRGASKFHRLYARAQRHWQRERRIGILTRPEDGDGSAILFER